MQSRTFMYSKARVSCLSIICQRLGYHHGQGVIDKENNSNATGARVVPRPRGYYIIPSLKQVPAASDIDTACYSLLSCRGSGPGGQGANSSSSKIELRADLDMLLLFLEEMEGAIGMMDPPMGAYDEHNKEAIVDEDTTEESDIRSPKTPSAVVSSINTNDDDERKLRSSDATVSDPEQDLVGLTGPQRIIEKLRSRFSSCLKSCSGRDSQAPTAILAGGAADSDVLIITCNQHRSNHMNTNACLETLRQLLHEASYVPPTEVARNKAFRASYSSVSRHKLRRQTGSNKRKAQQQVRKGLW